MLSSFGGITHAKRDRRLKVKTEHVRTYTD